LNLPSRSRYSRESPRCAAVRFQHLLAHQARGDLLVVLLVDLVGLRVGQDLPHLGDDHRRRHAARHFAGVVAAHAVGEHHQPVGRIGGDRILVVRAHHARIGAGRNL